MRSHFLRKVASALRSNSSSTLFQPFTFSFGHNQFLQAFVTPVSTRSFATSDTLVLEDKDTERVATSSKGENLGDKINLVDLPLQEAVNIIDKAGELHEVKDPEEVLALNKDNIEYSDEPLEGLVEIEDEESLGDINEGDVLVADTAETLEEVRARIFGNRIGNGKRSGMKPLKKKLKGEKIANYYMDEVWKKDPFLMDPKEDA